MVNLDLIDTAEMGIKRSFEKLREKYFPMLDYNFSKNNRLRVTIYEKVLNEKYTNLLFKNKNLS